MNTLKTAFVTATLIAVAYGAKIVLDRPASDAGAAFDEWNTPLSLMSDGGVLGKQPQIEVPAVSGAEQVGESPGGVTWNEGATGATDLAENPGALSGVVPIESQQGLPGQTAGGEDMAEWQRATPASAHAVVPAWSPPAPQFDAVQPAQHPSAEDPSSSGSGMGWGAESETSPFDQLWMAAEQKLQAGDLADALFKLSMLYLQDELTSEQRGRLIPLLDQLAGTVIYSPQHFFEAPHVCDGTVTLEQLAAQYQLPPAFLARVNRLDEASIPAAGQQMKVVRGPFRAELSLSRRELTLYLGRYYAGRFTVAVGQEAPTQLMQLQVVEKSGPRAYVDVTDGRQIPPGAAENPYGNYWIGLSSTNPRWGIHSSGAAIDAADSRGCISVSDADADDLQAILSQGSQIHIVL